MITQKEINQALESAFGQQRQSIREALRSFESKKRKALTRIADFLVEKGFSTKPIRSSGIVFDQEASLQVISLERWDVRAHELAGILEGFIMKSSEFSESKVLVAEKKIQLVYAEDYANILDFDPGLALIMKHLHLQVAKIEKIFLRAGFKKKGYTKDGDYKKIRIGIESLRESMITVHVEGKRKSLKIAKKLREELAPDSANHIFEIFETGTEESGFCVQVYYNPVKILSNTAPEVESQMLVQAEEATPSENVKESPGSPAPDQERELPRGITLEEILKKGQEIADGGGYFSFSISFGYPKSEGKS